MTAIDCPILTLSPIFTSTDMTMPSRGVVTALAGPNNYSGLAFGIGMERIAMLKYGINHMGKLFENDVEFLKQFKA